MPSGDVTACAVFCYFYYAMLGLPAVYIILPLVACGRVYYHCHWFGDTVLGIIVGTACSVMMVDFFD